MPKLMSVLLVVTAALLLAGPRPAHAQGPPANLETLVDRVHAAGVAPGVAATVFSSDGELASSVRGVRRAGAPDLLELDDPLHVGSLTKGITATTLARLVDDGELAWSSRPARIFSELRRTLHPAYRNVTLAGLLSHRAGVPPWVAATEIPALAGGPRRQRREAVERLLTAEPAGPRGAFLYSNASYTIAAAMAERVTGRSWRRLVREELLRPLDVRGVFGWPTGRDPQGAFGHIRTPAGFRPVASEEYPVPAAIAPAGDLSLRLRDYGAFARLHLAARRGHPRLLSRAAFARLHEPVGNYALGWIVGELDGERYYTHDGTLGTFYAHVLLVPARDVGVVVIANAGGADGRSAREDRR